jgi:alcohol dehydrogenase, propanol-preferring
MEVLELARQGKIRAHVQRFPLSQVTDVYQRLRQRDTNGRAVITPQEP